MKTNRKRVLYICVYAIGLSATQVFAQAFMQNNLSIQAEKTVIKKRIVPAKPAPTKLSSTMHNKSRIILKFQEGTNIRLRHHRLKRSETTELNEVHKLIESKTKSYKIDRAFTRPEHELDQEKTRGEHNIHQELADLNLYYVIDLPNAVDATKVEELINALNALDVVEIAYPEGKLGPPPRADISPPTPNFESRQLYLDSAPNGIDARYAWRFPGGKGEGVKFIDIETGWRLAHEDLKDPSIPFFLYPWDQNDHGTAVLGELVGDPNGFGISGIVPLAEYGIAASRALSDVQNKINSASATLSPGDVIILELQITGPLVTDCSKRRVNAFVPIEFDLATFDAIKTATANGIIVIEAAGNGCVDLDSAEYFGKFDRGVHDSGALLIGAGVSPIAGAPLPPYLPDTSREAEGFSNYGSRVDLQGWGGDVVTLGYGDLFNPSDPNQKYTAQFNGTSSATPMVAGAVLAVQGYLKQRNGCVLNANDMRQLLINFGTPQQGIKHIGPFPNLRPTIDWLAAGNFSNCDGKISLPNLAATQTDVNADGHSDLIWRNRHTGEVAFWLQNGFQTLDTRLLSTVAFDWDLVGIGDVNGDGRADLVWRNSKTGELALWLQDGFTTLDARVLQTVALEWQVVGIADVNGDGRADLVWRNSKTGEVALWLQNGFTTLDARVISTIPLEWQIVAIGDANGDGKADILWRNSNTNEVALWLQDGFATLQTKVLTTVSQAWQVIGFADVNGDGKSDIIWRHSPSGAISFWLQNSFDVMDARILPAVPLEWQIVGVGDVNGDHKADLVWRNVSTGDVALWLLDGFNVLDARVLQTVPLEWSTASKR